MDTKMKQFVESQITNSFGLSINQVAEKCKSYGRFSAWLNSDVSLIRDLLTIVQNAGVSPAFFASYERTEGYNSSWGWLNHTSINGTPNQDAKSVCNWIVTQSKNMTDNPAWIDYANYVDFVPQSVKNEGDLHFQTLPIGTIGRVIIAGTAAATWEVYYPLGLLKEYNQVQDYGAPITNMITTIESWGGIISENSTDPDDPVDPVDPSHIISLLTKDLFKNGNSHFYQNGAIIIQKQLDNTYKIKLTKKFLDELGSVNPTDPTIEKPLLPVKVGTPITDVFGERINPVTGLSELHNGTDYGGNNNDPIYATMSGVVNMVGFNEFRGNWIMIKHTTDNKYSKYLHLNAYHYSIGDDVSQGDIIGLMGTTGQSTGVHLHFTVTTTPEGTLDGGEFLDPEVYLQG